MGVEPVCAACNGPVSEGRCPTCRRSRQQLQPPALPAGPVLLLALAVLLLVVLLG